MERQPVRARHRRTMPNVAPLVELCDLEGSYQTVEFNLPFIKCNEMNVISSVLKDNVASFGF